MSRTSSSWINLGAFGINILSIKRNLDDSKASPFVELKDTDASKSGRPPKVNGSIPNLKARRSKTDTMTVVWTLRNVAHHDHVRTFATKFESQREAELFLLIFNGLAAEAEERCNKAHEDIKARVTRSLFSPVVVVKNHADEEEADADRDDEEDNEDDDLFEDDFCADEEEVDADRADEEDNKDDDSYEDEFNNTQEWPEEHCVFHPVAL